MISHFKTDPLVLTAVCKIAYVML